MVSDVDRAYIAGLFDGEGSVYYTRKPEKKKKHKEYCIVINYLSARETRETREN